MFESEQVCEIRYFFLDFWLRAESGHDNGVEYRSYTNQKNGGLTPPFWAIKFYGQDIETKVAGDDWFISVLEGCMYWVNVL